MRRYSLYVQVFCVLLFLPLFDLLSGIRLAEELRAVFIYAIMGLGLNVITGLTGLLNLGSAAFMAIGAYTFAILTVPTYPFVFGFWWALVAAVLVSALIGLLLAIPTLRLKGDYLAIVTLGFGEIVQDTLRNLETITKGTQGINPLPPPNIFGWNFPSTRYEPLYYLLLTILALLVVGSERLKQSKFGRAFLTVRDDEIAAASVGIDPVKVKVFSFLISAAFCGLSGVLWASYLSASGEPGNYDFQISVMTLCIVIVGGLGSTIGVLIGAVLIMGFNTVLLVKLASLFSGVGGGVAIFNPTNWKFLLFGLVLILTMRFCPNGLFPEVRGDK